MMMSTDNMKNSPLSSKAAKRTISKAIFHANTKRPAAPATIGTVRETMADNSNCTTVSKAYTIQRQASSLNGISRSMWITTKKETPTNTTAQDFNSSCHSGILSRAKDQKARTNQNTVL